MYLLFSPGLYTGTYAEGPSAGPPAYTPGGAALRQRPSVGGVYVSISQGGEE